MGCRSRSRRDLGAHLIVGMAQSSLPHADVTRSDIEVSRLRAELVKGSLGQAGFYGSLRRRRPCLTHRDP